MPSLVCRICHRSLSNYTSIKIGIGPICRGKLKIEEGGQMGLFDNRADYYVRVENERFIYIIDRGGVAKSVTNDIENVVAELAADGLGSRRLFYRDTLGGIDEALHRDGKFIDFRPGHKGEPDELFI